MQKEQLIIRLHTPGKPLGCSSDLAGFAELFSALDFVQTADFSILYISDGATFRVCTMEICYHLRLERKPISDYWDNLAHFQLVYHSIIYLYILYSFITILRLPFVWNATRRILRNRSRQRLNRRRRCRWRHPESGATAWWEAGNTCWLRHIKPTRSTGCADNPLIKRQCSSHRCLYVLPLRLCVSPSACQLVYKAFPGVGSCPDSGG